MFNKVFYHETIRRAVGVFGTIFNDIHLVRRDANGRLLNTVKVPLSYGPKQKFLSRIQQQADLNDPKIAIKLPRMSFELTSLSYDPNSKMQKGHKSTYRENGNTVNKNVLGPVGYKLGMQLNIMAKTQDDALQIIEQILPYFQPEYTVTVKQVNDAYLSDMPITLQGVNLSDEYEGDFTSRRVILYTLDFETKVRFYGPVVDSSIIKRVITNIYDDTAQDDDLFLIRQDVEVDPITVEDENDSYTIKVKNITTNATSVDITVDDVSALVGDEYLVGLTSGTAGSIVNINNNVITVIYPDGLYQVGESVTVLGGSGTAVITAFTENYDE